MHGDTRVVRSEVRPGGGRPPYPARVKRAFAAPTLVAAAVVMLASAACGNDAPTPSRTPGPTVVGTGLPLPPVTTLASASVAARASGDVSGALVLQSAYCSIDSDVTPPALTVQFTGATSKTSLLTATIEITPFVGAGTYPLGSANSASAAVVSLESGTGGEWRAAPPSLVTVSADGLRGAFRLQLQETGTPALNLAGTWECTSLTTAQPTP